MPIRPEVMSFRSTRGARHHRSRRRVGCVARERPDVVINCAAYNDVDGAEDNGRGALAINAFAVPRAGPGGRRTGAVLVHYGTDFVFDGHTTEPYTEADEPRPQSVYGASKLLGEWFAADARAHYVLRVESLFGGRQRRSSVDRIADAITAGQPARVFVDRTVTPSYVDDVADATWALIDDARRRPLSLRQQRRHDLAGTRPRVRELLGCSGELVPVKTADVTLRARRPQDCALSNAKLGRPGSRCPRGRMPWSDT